MNLLNNFSLVDKTALITGAAGVLGVEHANAILESGGNVILTDVNRQGLDQLFNDLANQHDKKKIKTLFLDVTDEKSIIGVKDLFNDQAIRLDILVNNAAIDSKVDKSKPLTEASRLENFSLERWNQEMAVGLTGAFLCCKHFGYTMAQNGGGVIINIASDLSVISPYQKLYEVDGKDRELQPVKPITYSAIKSGLIGLTKYMATYWSQHGIRCNALSPGGVFNNQDEDFVKRVSQLIPLGRMADRSEYKSAIQFLCSDASSYLNGHNLVMDGGRSIW